jgi:pimeloyl-ACP methyl ester carboxylesterase
MFKKIFIVSIILGIILTPYSFDFPETNNLYAQTEIHCSKTISQSATWTASNSPYIISGDYHLRILQGVVLTIEPGVIVKFSENGGLAVDGGEIIAKGTEENPIIFTSNNGSSYPQSGGWSSIEVYNHGKITLDYTKVEYGGFIQYYEFLDNKIFKPNTALAWMQIPDDFTAAITISGAQADINNSIIASSTVGLKVMDIGDPDYSDYATSTVSIHNSKIYNNDRYGILNDGSSQVDAINNWWGDNSGPYHPALNPQGKGDKVGDKILFDPWIGKDEKKDPVIIVPGIGACINLKVLIDSQSSSYDWQLVGNYYDGIIKTFEAAGFELNKNLFIGCYDWRKTNGLNSDAVVNSGEEYLKYWVDKAKQETGAEKVDIVAHSMGGLISRSYIQGDNYKDDVDQLIMLGTPNHGSSEAYYPWEGGQIPENWEKIKNILRVYLTILKFKGHNITNVSTIQEFIPSIKQLLPTYNYIFDEETQQFIQAYLMVENNNWLRNLNQETEVNKLKNRTGVNIIYGDSEPTLNTIAVLPRTNLDIQFNRWIDGMPDPNITDYKPNGDKTVTVNSAILDNIESYALENIKHNQLPDQAGLKVLELLNIESEQVFSSPNINNSLVIIVASPVFPIITAPDNESMVGYDIETRGIINNIEYAQYFSAGDQDVKLFIIPNPQEGEYKIELIGNGDGKYNLASGYFSDEQSVIKEIAGVITADQVINYQVELQPENIENPIGELIPEDNIPPVITINNPVNNTEYLHSEELIIDYTATDDFSGVANTAINLDNQILSTTTIDLFYYDLGEHVLNVTAVDNAGNSASVEVKFEIITNIDSAIRDIERIYDLNWISKKYVKQILIVELEVLRKRLDIFTKQKDNIEKLKQKISDNPKIKEKHKQKLLDQFDKRLQELEQQENKFIEKSLDKFKKALDEFYSKGMINQQGYDIIIDNINYLRENL